jgi:hypothetical protein
MSIFASSETIPSRYLLVASCSTEFSSLIKLEMTDELVAERKEIYLFISE